MFSCAADRFHLIYKDPGWVRNAKVAVMGKTVDGAQAGRICQLNGIGSLVIASALSFPVTTEIICFNLA